MTPTASIGGQADIQREAMHALAVNPVEQAVFVRAALALTYDEAEGAAPITESQVLMPRRLKA